MWISEAYAQATTTAAPDAGNPLMSFLPIILIFVVFWFLLIRPQQKRQKALREMIANVKKGDKVITSGGIIGKITEAGAGPEIEVEIAKDVRVKMDRSAVSAVVNPNPPAPSAANDKPMSPLGRLFGVKKK